jgi:hypothetical protein
MLSAIEAVTSLLAHLVLDALAAQKRPSYHSLRSRGGVAMCLLVFLVIALAGPTTASGVELVPLEIRPVSVSFSVHVSGPGSFDFAALPGTDSASIQQPYSTPDGFTGQFDATVTINSDRLTVDFSGSKIQDPNALRDRLLSLVGTVVLEFDVPDIGLPLTPLFLGWDTKLLQDVGWYSDERIPSAQVLASESLKVFGGEFVPNATTIRGWGYVTNPVRLAQFVSSDTIRLSVWFSVGKRIDAGTLGSFLNSFELRFRTVAPMLGSGDVNGDGSVDILDVSLMRRALAGLPVALGK